MFITVQLKGTFRCAHNGQVITIPDSLFHPNIATLISVDQLTRMGLLVLFDNEAVSFYRNRDQLKNNKPVLKSHRRIGEKLYTIRTKTLVDYNDNPKKFKAFLTKVSEECDVTTLHQRFDHAPLFILKKLFPHLQNVDRLPTCLTCVANTPKKAYKKSFAPDKGVPIVINSVESQEVSLEAKIEKCLANFDSDDGNRRYGRYLVSDTKVLLTMSQYEALSTYMWCTVGTHL